MELLKTLFEGVGLTTDFEEKASVIFEAAVDEKVKEQLASLQESFEKQLEEQKETYIKESAETIDKLVEEAIVEWAKENSVGLDSQVKATIAEQFLGGLKGLFEQAEIQLHGDSAGEIQKLQEQVSDLTKTVDEKQTALTEAEAVITSGKIKAIIESVTEGLADTVVHRITRLCEAFDFKSEEDFRGKVALVKEAVTGGASSAPSSDGSGNKGSSLEEPHKDNQFNAPNAGEGSGNTNSPLEDGKNGSNDGKFNTAKDGNVSGTYDADGTVIVVREAEQTPEQEKAALKEQFEKTKQSHAPHYGEDLVKATLALM